MGHSLTAQTSNIVLNKRILTLEDAIQIAQEQSFAYKVAYNNFQRSMWSYALFRSSFYPSLSLEGTIPNYSRAINKITLPSGEDIFVNQNQAFSSLRLGISQRVAWTGGSLSLFSSLDRIDVLGQNAYHRYAMAPFSISYFQDHIGYNESKWLKNIEPLRFESANKEFITDMENIAATTVGYYFATLSAQTSHSLSIQNLRQSDTLFARTQERFKLGTVSQGELLQLRLKLLNAQQQVAQDSIQYILAWQNLTSYLLLPDDQHWDLQASEDLKFKKLLIDDVFEHAQQHGSAVLGFQLKKLEANQSLAKTRADHRLKFQIQANLGVSNTAQTWGGLWNGLENQQQFLIGFSIPILDWGYSRTQKQRAEANLAMVESQIQQEYMLLSQEVALQVSRWNLQQQQLILAKESQAIATQNYTLELERFLRGAISLNDLNAAQHQKDQTVKSYLNTLEMYWQALFTLRKLTLYDFFEGQPIRFVSNNPLQ